MDQVEHKEPDTSTIASSDVKEGIKDDPTAKGLQKDPFSLYECPTAACSIISRGSHNDTHHAFGHGRFTSFSLDGSESDTNIDRSEESVQYSAHSNPTAPPASRSGEGGSVSYSPPQQATGGYVDQSEGMLIQGTAILTERPRNLIPSAQMAETPLPRFPVTTVRSVMMPTSSASSTPMRIPVPETPLGVMGSSTTFSAPQTPTMIRERSTSPVNISSSISNTSPVVKDYSRAVDCGNTSETSFFHEGYETIQVPRYRPVEIVEKKVEVPVVHHVDTYVPKKEVQEIESVVRKPFVTYVNKVVDVPEIHYNDTIVEVPEYHEVTETVQKVEIQERIKYVPKVEVKVVPKYVEVPVVKVVEKYEEYEEVEEVIKHVEKVEIVEVPREVIKHVIKPVKKIIERERIIPVVEHRDVPVEKIKFVPKVETVELKREVPKIVDVPVPYNVFKVEYVDQPYMVPEYRDVPVAVPVRKMVTPVYHYNGDPEVIHVPVHKPYLVIHDHIAFKPASHPLSETLKVVGTRPLDLSSMSEEERKEAEERMKSVAKERMLCTDNTPTRVHQQNPTNQETIMTPRGDASHNYISAYSTVHSKLPNPLGQVSDHTKETVHVPLVRTTGAENMPNDKNWLGKSVETIIYSNKPSASPSPFYDRLQGDLYPPSSTPTPRMGS